MGIVCKIRRKKDKRGIGEWRREDAWEKHPRNASGLKLNARTSCSVSERE